MSMKKEKELLVAVASQKGGVGKSVFTVLLASVLHYHKGLRVAVVDCDSPQHSIALMRERDIENVMKNDDLKVGLYRQHERIQKPAYPVIKSDPEKAVEDLRRYTVEKGEAFDVVLFDLPGTLRSEGVVYTVAAMDYIFVPLKADNIVMQSSLQFAKALVTRNFAASLFRNIKYFTLRKLYLCRKWMQKRLQKTTTTGITLPNFDFLA